MTRLERPASSPVEAFIATAPQASLNSIFTKSSAHANRNRRQTDNNKLRLSERLGPAQVLTNGKEGESAPSLVDGSLTSNAWLAAQTPRLVNVFNIHYLREAAKGPTWCIR